MLITPHAETSNREAIAAFWGQVEQHHKRKDAVPGRTASVALPCELSREENLRLMYGYGRWLSKTYGIGVQVTAHQLDGGNPHFHLTITSCAVLPDGSFGKKVMRLDPIAMQRNKEESPAETLRAGWADMVNKAYAEAGVAEHVDHRSYARRGISKIPTVHEGVWHHAPCPVNHPAELNASIRLCNLARQEEKQQAKQQEAIRKEHQKARQAKYAARQTTGRQSPGQLTQVQTAADAGKNTAAEQQHVIAGVEGQKGGKERKTAASKAAPLPQETAAPKPVKAASISGAPVLRQTEEPEPQPATGAAAGKPSQTARSEDTRRASTPAQEKPAQPAPGADAKGYPAVPQTEPPASKPQNAPAQQTGYARAWEIIKSFARALPKTNRETMLLAACLQFCEKYPRVTASHIKNILERHSKSSTAEQQHIIVGVAEHIAGRQIQKEEGKEKTVEERISSATPKAAPLPQETAAPKPVNADSVPESRVLPQAEKPVPQPVSDAATPVPSTAGPANTKNAANHFTAPPDAAYAVPACSPEDPTGPSLRSVLQAYCDQHAELAGKAGELGEVGQRDVILAELRAPVGDQLAGLRRWLFRHNPTVAQEIGKRLSLAHRTRNSEDRLRALESVFRYLPPDFVRNRLGIGMQEDSTDAVADVAAAMNCTRSEAVQRLASIMPDLLRIQKCTDGKNAAWLDCISIYEQQELAYNKPTQEDYYGIRPE